MSDEKKTKIELDDYSHSLSSWFAAASEKNRTIERESMNGGVTLYRIYEKEYKPKKLTPPFSGF